MAIAVDATASGESGGSTTTFSHTCTGSDRILFVSIVTYIDTSDRVTGVTYSGVSMTRVESYSATDFSCYFYWLIAPATGANNIVISKSGSPYCQAVSASYTGAKQTGGLDATAKTVTGGNVTSLSQALTTIADNCWVVGGFHNAAGVTSAQSGTTIRVTGATTTEIGDSNGVVTPAGSKTLGYNCNSNKSSIIVASFAPAAASGHTKSLLTLGVG